MSQVQFVNGGSGAGGYYLNRQTGRFSQCRLGTSGRSVGGSVPRVQTPYFELEESISFPGYYLSAF
jgi:hypothetical protein